MRQHVVLHVAVVAVALRFETRQKVVDESASTRSDDPVEKAADTAVVPVAHVPPDMKTSRAFAPTAVDVPDTVVHTSAAGSDGR